VGREQIRVYMVKITRTLENRERKRLVQELATAAV
jgi:hypothetical protein